MEIVKFKEILKNNNAVFLNDEWTIFNDFELYNGNKDITIENNTIEELLEREIDGKTIKELIEEKEEFTFKLGGGRGAMSRAIRGKMGFASTPGRRAKGEKLLPAELNLDLKKGNSVEKVLSRFQDKYGDANREYAIAVDERGYAYQHIKGGKHSVGISGDKGQIIIHNHPSGSNFSKADLENVASTKAKGVIATSSNKSTKGTYTFIKNDNFKAKEFIKGLNKAEWDRSKGYNKGVSEWLKKNQRTYGYKYTSKGVRNANW